MCLIFVLQRFSNHELLFQLDQSFVVGCRFSATVAGFFFLATVNLALMVLVILLEHMVFDDFLQYLGIED